jgi:hypothetical protein
LPLIDAVLHVRIEGGAVASLTSQILGYAATQGRQQ